MKALYSFLICTIMICPTVHAGDEPGKYQKYLQSRPESVVAFRSLRATVDHGGGPNKYFKLYLCESLIHRYTNSDPKLVHEHCEIISSSINLEVLLAAEEDLREGSLLSGVIMPMVGVISGAMYMIVASPTIPVLLGVMVAGGVSIQTYMDLRGVGIVDLWRKADRFEQLGGLIAGEVSESGIQYSAQSVGLIDELDLRENNIIVTDMAKVIARQLNVMFKEPNASLDLSHQLEESNKDGVSLVP